MYLLSDLFNLQTSSFSDFNGHRKKSFETNSLGSNFIAQVFNILTTATEIEI